MAGYNQEVIPGYTGMEVIKEPTADEDGLGREWYWPRGHEIATLRALVRKGAMAETTGICEGCTIRMHRGKRHLVPVFFRDVPLRPGYYRS